MSSLFSVDKQSVAIIGGTSGIGLGIARHLAQEGARVIITGRRSEGAELAGAVNARFVQMDIACEDSITAAAAQIADAVGGALNGLVLNAGIEPEAGPCQHMDLSALRHTFEVNLFGIAATLKAALPLMAAGSSIVATSSPAASVYIAGMGAYSASKAALQALIKTAAIELGPQGIRINGFLPGIVPTEMSLAQDAAGGELDKIRAMNQTGKVRQPEEMGPIVQFLLSPASGPVTGTILGADDGLTAGLSNELLDKAFGGIKI